MRISPNGRLVARASGRTPRRSFGALALPLCAALATACQGDDVSRPPLPEEPGIYGAANGCFTVDASRPDGSGARFLAADEGGASFAFTGRSPDEAARFTFRASDLGTYLLYDSDRRYLVAEGGVLERAETLLSDQLLNDDAYESPAEWELEVSAHDAERYQLRHRVSGEYLSRDGLVADVADAGVVTLYPAEGCAPFPELTLDAEGTPRSERWDDGAVYGIVDAHSHIMSNFGFGGGGVFHGAPYHRLGVEHALPDCTASHGGGGRRDVMGFGYDKGSELRDDVLLSTFLTGRTPTHNHETDGYPTFTDWPNAPGSSTHQTQYYLWLKRAYMAGLRLMVQHATSSSVMCDIVTGRGVQEARYSCNDMVAVDRSIEETYNLERYIDAQEGGPGMGWLRIVTSPAEAREVIDEGKLAIVLGIELSNIFDCFRTPPPGFPACTEAFVTEQLDRYHELGVRVLFPVHKFDNGFSAGDGNRGIIEAGNFINTGHYSSFTLDCDLDSPLGFDKGSLVFGGINMPGAEYFSDPPVDMSMVATDPVGTLLPHLDAFQAGSLEGEYCQSHGLTSLGEHLIREMMKRGMLIEMDHFSRRSYERAFDLLEENDYPGVGSHGLTFDGRLYALGGMSTVGLGRCFDPANPRTSVRGMLDKIALKEANGGYPAEGFGFDLNGFAGGPGPRFAEGRCGVAQESPITYPFDSYDGSVSFTQPHLAERVVDFNMEGMVHVGLLPELLEDARHDGATDEDLEPLFRSAEAYLRTWERAEERAAALR